MLWIRLSLKDLINNKGFALFFIINLSIGLAGFTAIQSFSRSLNRYLDENLKQMLTADLVLSANASLTAEELALADNVLGPQNTSARLIRFYTMVRAKDRSRLVQVMAVDEGYPLYGTFLLKKGHSGRDLQNTSGVFMSRDTALALGIKDTDAPDIRLALGEKTFHVLDIFAADPDQSLLSVEFAPKLYMGINQIQDTGLIKFGSRIRYRYYYRLNREVDIPQLAQRLRAEFFKRSGGQPRVNIRSAMDVNQRLGRVTGYFTRYMGLVSVVALFLAGIATAYLFRGFLNKKQHEIAVLMSLGAKHGEIYFYMSFQLVLLGFLASCLAVCMAFFLVPVFPVIFQGLIPPHVKIIFDPTTVIPAAAMGIGGSLIFCLPVFIRIFRLKPLILLSSSRTIGRKPVLQWLFQAAGFLPGLTAFYLISVRVAGSVEAGSVFAGGFALALVFLSGMGWLIFSGCRLLSATRNTVGKIAFRNLFRNKWASLSCFVTIAMGTFLISIVPQIQNGLQTEIMQPKGLKIPVFFLTDIQEEQKSELVEFINLNKAGLVNISPMVRGRILTVNDQPFYNRRQKTGSDTSETENTGRRRRLEFNFSHRKTLDVSETIIRGAPLSKTPWTFESNTLFGISVESSFAERHHLAMGDRMEFEIQGIPMTGQIKNLRKVRWNSFQPNFFLLFQDGVLNDAPKTYLAAVSRVPIQNRQQFKNEIVKRFPNIVVIDVSRMVTILLSLTDRLSLSIRFMAWLAVAAGLVSIFSIARQEARKNENQINLLKVLGAEFKTIQAILLVEFGFIGFTAALLAILLSFAFSWAFSGYFFDHLWQINFKTCAAILCVTTLICMVTPAAASRKIMNSKPAKLLTTT